MSEITLLDDSYIDFVGEKMAEVGEEYTKKDLEMTMGVEHAIIGCKLNGRIVGFCVLMKPAVDYYVSYTWCEKTLEAKRVFLKGIRYLVDNYPGVKFIEEREPIMYKAYLKTKGK
jgi:hypothetical protein